MSTTSRTHNPDALIDAPPAFRPDRYVPWRQGDVQILDRGSLEPHRRYVLEHVESGAYVTLSEEDLRLWDLFDGERNVQEVLEEYVRRHRTIPVDRVIRLIRRLWLRGFLANDPGFPYAGGRLVASGVGPARVPGLVMVPLRGVRGLFATCAQMHLERLASLPFIFLITVAGFAGIGVLISLHGEILPTLWAAFPRPGSLPSALAGVLLITFVVSGAREFFRGLVMLRVGTPPDRGGILWRWGVPLFHVGARGTLARPRRERIRILGAGVWFDICAAGIATLLWYWRYFAASPTELCIIAVLYMRVLAVICPFMKNDLYLALTDLLDEPDLRGRTFGFLCQRAGRPGEMGQTREGIPYLVFLLWVAAWIDGVLVAAYGFAVTLSTTITVDIASTALVVLGLPVILVALLAVAWGGRLIAENMSRHHDDPLDTPVMMTELIGLGGLTLFSFFLPQPAGKIFAVNLLFICIVAILLGVLRLSPWPAKSRPRTRFAILGLWAQILWIPLALLLHQSLAGANLHVYWTVLVPFLALLPAYAVHSWLRPDFMNRGPLLGLAEGFVWISFVLVTLCTADFMRLAQLQQDFSFHPFSISGIVLGAGLLFLGLAIPARVARRCQVTALPFPFSAAHESNRSKLEKAFAYFVATLFDTIISTFGAEALSKVKREYNRRTDRGGTQTPCLDPDTHFECVDIKASQYGEYFHHMRDILSQYCGRTYANDLFAGILERVHSDSRRLLQPLIYARRETTDAPVLDQEQKLELLRAIHLFRGASDQALLHLTTCIEQRHVAAGAIVAGQDSPCTVLFIVVAGTGLSEECDIAGERIAGAHFQPHDYFGEKALLPEDHSRFPFGIRATEPMDVACIGKDDFHHFCNAFASAGAIIRENVRSIQALKKTAIFRELSPQLASFLLSRIQHETYRKGETVIREGDIGQRFYIIERGRAQAVKSVKGHPRVLGELRTGEYFGEIALLRDVPRTATVEAVEDMEVGVIDKNDFLALLSGSKQLQENVDAEARKRTAEQQPPG